jgi:EAL domain-containing protein (putative c-di-GMP-specific phosphodiesterase class I)
MVPTGVEALIRWRSGVRGVVQPNDFIPLPEETGLIVEVGRVGARRGVPQRMLAAGGDGG